MIARSPREPVAMMLLVRVSTENRTGASERLALGRRQLRPRRGAGRLGGNSDRSMRDQVVRVAVDDLEDLDLGDGGGRIELLDQGRRSAPCSRRGR